MHIFSRLQLMALMALPLGALAQEPLLAGGEGTRGSYAEYTPLAKSKTTEHGGDQSQYMQYRQLYINEVAGQPIPTNDWWTDLINADRGRSGKELTGHLWSLPQYVQGMTYGLDIHYPKYWVDNGTEVKAQSKLTISGGEQFHPTAPRAETWSDWTVAFSETDGSRRMLTTLAHGVPFTWIETTGIDPVLKPVKTDNDGADNHLKGTVSVTFTDAEGNALTGEQTLTQFVVSIDRADGDGTDADLYGVYLPTGTTVTLDGAEARVALGEEGFVVVALLQQPADLAAYAPYAYSRPTDTRVTWDYAQATGTLTTHWQVSATDLRTGQATNSVVQGFLPHHYRRNTGGKANGTLTDLTFFGDRRYLTPRGPLRLVASNNVDVSYKFSGMLPWYPAPADTDGEHAFDAARMLEMLQRYADTGTFGGDTYWGGKGLTQMALNMMFAREMNDEQLFSQCHDRLKETLVDWLTYTPGEDAFFFAYDRRYHGLIGYNTSYDSDTYNDHHFHYGYFTLAAALLAMVDDDFRQNYGDMIRLVARDYNNYRRDTWACFLRMMDPWAGHCYAGGMGDGAGNGQESTSESMQAWGGMFLLGVALGDDELRDAGIFGWTTEARATAEYWFDRHGDTIGDDFHTTNDPAYNIDYTKFKHTRDGVVDYTIPYSSNLTSHGVGWWTWFGGDPVFMQGIQWMPISTALDYLGEDKAFAEWDYQRLMELKEHVGWQDYSGDAAWLGDSDWGNVVLSYRQWSDPDDAAAILDEGWQHNWPTMRTSSTNGITYFVTHAHRTYGDIDWSVTADQPTARVYSRDGQRYHVTYNPTDEPLSVTYSDGTTFSVAPRQLKVYERDYAAVTTVYPVDTTPEDIRERLVMKNLALGRPCTESSHENAGTLPEYATDGKTDTRWSSLQQDGEWLQVDLGETANIYKVRVKWEPAYAAEYRIELRETADGEVTYSKTGAGKPGDWTELAMDDHAGRYVRLVGVKRGTQYGTSLYELEVYGRAASAQDGELMGVEISSSRAVLKQGEPTELAVAAYDYARQPMAVEATWSSADGTFDGCVFTPAKYGNVTVTATVGGMTVTRVLPVEESLRLTSLTFVVPGFLVKDVPATFTISGKDQFGGPLTASPTFETSSPALTVDAANSTITATATGTYSVTATLGGAEATAEVIVIDGAPEAPSMAGKVPVFVGQEEPSMNFDYNGGSQQTGPSFLLTAGCRAVYVKQLGTCGFGPLSNLPLDGANMLHADIYPIADAPDFSIHIEGDPGNREYAKTLVGGRWNSVDLPVTNTTANWLFFSFSNYQAGSNAALIANVYFYTATGDKVYVSDPDGNGLVSVTSFGTGITDDNVDEFLSDVAQLPQTATAIDLSQVTLGNSEPMTIATPNNPNVMLLLSGSGGDDHAASPQQAKLTNDRNLAYKDGGWILPLETTDFRVVLTDGYPVLSMNFGRNTRLTYTRTIAAGNYATVCLPRDVVAPEGLAVYELTDATADEMTFSRLATGAMTAYKPYLVRNMTGEALQLAVNGVQGNMELGRGVDALSTKAGNVTMVGNFRRFRVVGTEGYAAFRPTGQLAWLSNQGTTVGAFRAYLTDATEQQLSRVMIDGTTGMGDLSTTLSTGEGVFYDLQGRPVDRGCLRPGVYVKNGKKIVVLK